MKPKDSFKSRKRIEDDMVALYREDRDDTRHVRVKNRESVTDYNSYERNMVHALDVWRDVQKLTRYLTKLDKDEIDLPTFFKGVETEAIKTVLLTAMSGENEKNKLDAAKHILALAGHSPTTKMEVSRVDPDMPRQALINMLMGNKTELEDEGIVIEEDSDNAKAE